MCCYFRCKASHAGAKNLITTIHLINKLKNKSPMIISLDDEKAFNKIQHPFMTKVLERSGIQGTYLYIIMAVYSNSTANITLSREKIPAIPQKPGIRQGCLLSPYLLNIDLEVLTRTIRQQNKIKRIQIKKEKSNSHYLLMIWWFI